MLQTTRARASTWSRTPFQNAVFKWSLDQRPTGEAPTSRAGALSRPCRFCASCVRGRAILDEGWAEVGNPRASDQRERGVDLLAQEAQHVGGALLTPRGEPVERRAPKHHRASA